MKRKSELFSNTITAVLEKIEISPSVVFSLAHLKQIDKSILLTSKDVFKKVYRDTERTSYTDEDGERRYYRKRGENIISLGGSGVLAEDKESVEFYQYDVQVLIQNIKTVNALTGQVCSIDDRITFIGECSTGDRQFGVFLALLSDDEQAKRLLGLRSNTKQYERNLVLCPTFEVSDQNLLNRLENQNIYCVTFKQAFKSDSHNIDFNIIPDKSCSLATGFVIDDLSATERRKYQKEYPRRDIFQFIDKQNTGRKAIVVINGKEIEFEYNLYGILLSLAKALKSEVDSGWIHYDAIANEKLVRSRDHFHRSMSELSVRIKAAPLEKNNPAKIIENLARKSKYRLSIMPSRIKTPHTKWLSSRYQKIKNEIIKERTKRLGEANV